MKISAFKQMIKESLEDAKKDKKDKAAKLPKSSGKLVDMKKELEALKQMKDELQTAKFAEKTASTEVEFANLAKFKSELDKIKAGGVALEAKIDSRITELETKIGDEKNKIREMIGLAPKAGQKQITSEATEEELKPGSYVELIHGEMTPGTQYQVQSVSGGYAKIHDPKGKELTHNVGDLKLVSKTVEESNTTEELDEAKKAKPKLKVSAIVTKTKKKEDDKKVVAKKPIAKKK